ncbi:MAG: phosphatidylglycerol lysyltransferase domain-containing protein [Desulfovibrionaceae bacterium]|nr:phosphatidylglycerol lysyltransferase domain-containing protein [Desulfovibrionaceae bacterium]
MGLEFEPLSIERMNEYNALLARCPERTSDSSFANLWGWAEHYGLEWSFAHGLAWVRQTLPEVRYWCPVGPWETTDWTACPALGQGASLTRIPETLAKALERALGPEIRLRECREHWDYLYSVPELIELSGNKFHKKKNLLNQFVKGYDFEYKIMDLDCVEDVLEMQAEWRHWWEEGHEPSEALGAENRAIARVLHDFDRIKCLMGAAIRVKGKVVAYTVAECLERKKTVVIHFEKADIAFRGAYQAINQMFLQNSASEYALVNREQDLGDPGLRRAKLSYNPVGFVPKYDLEIIP